MDALQISGKWYISARRAAKEHGYHADYIGQLIRSGKVKGQKVGRGWYVLADSLTDYLGSAKEDEMKMKSTLRVAQKKKVSQELEPKMSPADTPGTGSGKDKEETRAPADIALHAPMHTHAVARGSLLKKISPPVFIPGGRMARPGQSAVVHAHPLLTYLKADEPPVATPQLQDDIPAWAEKEMPVAIQRLKHTGTANIAALETSVPEDHPMAKAEMETQDGGSKMPYVRVPAPSSADIPAVAVRRNDYIYQRHSGKIGWKTAGLVLLGFVSLFSALILALSITSIISTG